MSFEDKVALRTAIMQRLNECGVKWHLLFDAAKELEEGQLLVVRLKPNTAEPDVMIYPRKL